MTSCVSETPSDQAAIGSGTTCRPYTLAPCAHHVKPFTEYPGCSSSENSTPSLFACSEASYLKAYRDDKQKNSAAYSLSTVEGIQQISRSRQHSRRRSDSAVRCGRTLRIDQIVDTNRSRRGAGVHVYNPHLLDIRSTSSSVCKAGALVSPSSCLDGEPHGWVPVDTHSTPVPSLTGEAVGGLSNFTSPIHHRNTRNPNTFFRFFLHFFIF